MSSAVKAPRWKRMATISSAKMMTPAEMGSTIRDMSPALERKVAFSFRVFRMAERRDIWGKTAVVTEMTNTAVTKPTTRLP